MAERNKEQVATVVGIDLAKRSFHVYGADAQGQQVFTVKGGGRLAPPGTISCGRASRSHGLAPTRTPGL